MKSAKLNPFLKLTLYLLPLILFLSLFLFSFKNNTIMVRLYGNLSFYIVAALVISWFFQLYKYLEFRNFDLKKFLQLNWIGIVCAFILTAVIFYSVPVYFKVLNDETNLLSVSQSMFYEKQAFRISMSKVYHNQFHIVENKTPKRPLVFPFAVFLLHTIAGYHYQNVYIFNFIIMFIFLSGSFICTNRFTDPLSAISALFFICAYPVFTIYGASGGFDLFSALFFFLSMIILFQYIDSPSHSGFAFLWSTLLMFSNIRYESVIFLFIIPAGIVLIKKKIFIDKFKYLYLFTPLFMLPYIWQRFLSQGRYENPLDQPLFGVEFFLKNFYTFIQNFLNLELYLPYSGILNFLGIILILCLCTQLTPKKRLLPRNQMYFWSIFCFCIALNMTIILSHFMGRYDHPASARFFINISICFALTPIIIRIKFPQLISGKRLFVLSLVLFFMYHPIASADKFNSSLKISRIHKECKIFLDQITESNVLVISGYSSQFASMNYGTVTFDYVNKNKELIQYNMINNKYEKIISIQEINKNTQQPLYKNQFLDPSFRVTPIKKVEVFKNITLWISEVTINKGKII